MAKSSSKKGTPSSTSSGSKSSGKKKPSGKKKGGAKTASAPAKLPKSLRKGDLPRALGDVWAAGVGALAQAKTTGTQAFEALVARGESVTQQGSKAARAAVTEAESAAGRYVDQARSTADGAVDGVQSRLESAVEGILASLGVPNRDEVSALRTLVDGLEQRIAALTGEGAPVAEADRPAYEVAPHPDGWAVRRVGVDRALAVRRTKKEALQEGRASARAHAPSTLTIRTLDGEVSDVMEYEP